LAGIGPTARTLSWALAGTLIRAGIRALIGPTFKPLVSRWLEALIRASPGTLVRRLLRSLIGPMLKSLVNR
jgi:hypothetical protein